MILACYYGDELRVITKNIKRLNAVMRLVQQRRGRLNVEAARNYPLADLCEQLGIELRKTGRLVWALCPLHSERNASFMGHLESNKWRCWGCGQYGDTIALLMKVRDVDFVEAVRFLSGGVK